MSRRSTLVVLGVIFLQVLIPTIALLMAPPTRFGFQMFAGYEQGNSIVIRDSSGDSIPFDPGDLWPAALRPELDWTKHVPAYACRHVTGAHDIVVFQHASGRVVVPCP